MIRTMFHTPRKALDSQFPLAAIPQALKDRRGLLWIDFSGEKPEVCLPVLEQFTIHPLAIEEALQESHTPKVDDWGDYLHVVVQVFTLAARDSVLDLSGDEVDIFLGSNYIITHHDLPAAALDTAWAACLRDSRHLAGGADHLLYRILDAVVTDYMPQVEKIDLLEDEVFNKPSAATLERLFGLKRILLSTRRILTPQREVLNKLARDDYRVIDHGDRIFFRNIYDHLVRMHDLNESMRDLVGSALETYLSVINNRMNEVMKTLTVITTMFMPISFIAGFFGMNFFEPQRNFLNWTSLPVFLVMLGFVVLVPFLMFLWMRKRMWV